VRRVHVQAEQVPATRPPSLEAASASRVRKAMVASAVGNILEWYDFGVFAFLSPQIGQLFFPSSDRFVSTLNAYVVFGGGFVFRPLGGIVLAHIGTVHGRKTALLVSVVGMAGATATMGCLPTYHEIGPLAPILLSLLRLIQGLSVGGELVASIVFAVESMPPHRQVLGGALCMAGAIAGLTLGAATGLILHALFTPEQILRVGWRIPFWCGLLIGLFALWLRHAVHEPGAGADEGDGAVLAGNQQHQAAERSAADAPGESKSAAAAEAQGGAEGLPVLQAVRTMPVEICLCFAVASMWCAACWLTVAFPPTLYQALMSPPLSERIRAAPSPAAGALGGGAGGDGGLHGHEGAVLHEGAVYRPGEQAVWAAHTGCCALQGLAILGFGFLGDVLGGTRLLLIGALGTAVVSPLCFYAMSASESLPAVAAAQGLLMVVAGACGATLPSWMVLAFPKHLRFSAIAIGYNAAQVRRPASLALACVPPRSSVVPPDLYAPTQPRRASAGARGRHAVVLFVCLFVCLFTLR
jgi:MFS family permease